METSRNTVFVYGPGLGGGGGTPRNSWWGSSNPHPISDQKM